MAVFSDRMWVLKLAVAAGAFAGLTLLGGADLKVRYADLEEAANGSVGLVGKIVRFENRRVLVHHQDGFDVETDGPPLRLWTALRLPVGSWIAGYARITAPGRNELVSLRVCESYKLKRVVTYGVSIAVVLGFLVWVRRHFTFGRGPGFVRARPPHA
jgi:hypothetical protein